MGVFDNVKQVVDGVKEQYDDDEYCPEGFVRASHILFLAADGDAQKKAAALKARIDAGEFSFGDAARAFSYCPTRDLNGQLGIFQSLSKLTEGTLRGDSMPYDGKDTATFDALLFSAELNVVHAVDTQWGTHLVLIEERGSEAPDLAKQAFDAGVDRAADLVQQVVGGAKATDSGRTPSAGFGGGGGSGSGGSSKLKKKRKKKRCGLRWLPSAVSNHTPPCAIFRCLSS